MRAVVLVDEAASSPELVELEKPEPGEGEIRVKVAAASVNGFDLAVAAGHTKGLVEQAYPTVLGKDFAGTVDALGAGVSEYSVGDRVFGTVTYPRCCPIMWGRRISPTKRAPRFRKAPPPVGRRAPYLEAH